jgi:hypothetical protein
VLKLGEVNPLNVHGLRQLSHCPPHFEQVEFVSVVTNKKLSDWIFENLQGRFYIGNVDTAQQRHTVVAFELASEASYFSLLLPQINYF